MRGYYSSGNVQVTITPLRSTYTSEYRWASLPLYSPQVYGHLTPYLIDEPVFILIIPRYFVYWPHRISGAADGPHTLVG
jgi:hypothetical protein